MDEEQEQAARGETLTWCGSNLAVRREGRTLHLMSAAGPGMPQMREAIDLPPGRHLLALNVNGNLSALTGSRRDGRDAVLYQWNAVHRQWDRMCKETP